MSPARRLRQACSAAAVSLLLAGAAVAAAQSAGVGSVPQRVDPAERRQAGQALSAQATTQAALDDLDAAEDSYLEAIELVSSAEGEFSPLLIDVYRGLADVFSRRGEYAEALTLLEQARHLSHRNFGLFNLDQAGLLDEISGVYEAAGDTHEAQETQRELLKVAVRHFGGETAGVIPFHVRLAEYYELARMRALAREQYEAVLAILAEDPATPPSAWLEPLGELVRIDIVSGATSPARQRLLEALDASGESDPAARGRALAILGDWELCAGNTEAAFGYYRDAYASLASESPDTAEDFFGSPRMLNFVPPASPVDLSRAERRPYAWGFVTARFGLSASGRAAHVEITASQPPGLLDQSYIQRLNEAVFRPRMVAGQPAPTESLRYSHEFRYFVEVEQEAR
jgi:tetratricopeptide (TPR) repeat protein